MKLRRVFNSTTSTMVMILILQIAHLHAWYDPSEHVNKPLEIKVGVILDMESSLGKTIYGCITMAVSDFYAHNLRYKTKVVLHTRDSKGEPLSTLSAALDLAENIKVHAIIGPETSYSSKFLAILGNKAKVPIFSFAASSSSYIDYPFFLQIAPDQTTQFKVIATVLEYYKWSHIIYIYEDTDSGRETITYMVDSLHEKGIDIIYKCAISPMATGDKILDQLHKLIPMSTTTFVVHVSPSLASRLFSKANRLGMMTEGHSWFLTDKTMNFFDSLDGKTIKSLKGALGVKPFIPASKKLRKFSLRWRNDQQGRNETLVLEPNELNVFGMWSYDTTWALAEAVEKVGLDILTTKEKGLGLNFTDLANIEESPCGRELLDKILETKCDGLSGEFRLTNGQLFWNAFEIVNVIGKYDVTIGFWTLTNGLTRENNISAKPLYGLQAVIWPGGSTSIPRGQKREQINKKLKIGAPMKSGFHELLKLEYSPELVPSFSGYCIDVFSSTIKSLNYEVSYDLIPYNGTYTDLLDQVYFQNFDAAVGDITITSNRSSYVDFTTTFTDIGVGTIAKTTNRGKWFFMKPLDADLWLTIAGLFISMVIVIGAIEYHVNEEIQGLPSKKFGSVLWFSLLVLVFAHSDKLKGNLSKVLATGWTLVLLILISSYTAILSSVLTVQQIQIASMNSVGYRRSDIVLGAVINNINYTDGRLKPYRSPEEFARDLSLGSKRGGVTVILDEIPYLKVFLAKYSSGYSMIGSEKTTNGFGFAFQKGSPLVSNISAAIQKLREDGTLLMLEKKWFRKTLLMDQDDRSKPTTLSIEDFRCVFVVMAVLLVLAVLMLVYWIYKHTIVPRYIYLCDGNDEMAT